MGILICVAFGVMVLVAIGSRIWALHILGDARTQCAGDENAQRRLDASEIVMWGGIMTRKGE